MSNLRLKSISTGTLYFYIKQWYNFDMTKENINLKYPKSDTKNVFLTDDKKSKYYLISLKSDKKIDIKEFKNKYDTRHLSFARENDLKETDTIKIRK